MRGLRLAFVVALLATAGAGGVVAQAHREPYRQGMDAMDAGRWNEAIPHFREAIAARSEESRGAIRRPYVPHFQLGLAYYRMGNCATAVAVWEESKRQGVVRSMPAEWATLTRAESECRVLAERSALELEIEEAVVAAYAVRELEEKPEAAPVLQQGSPTWGEKLATANRQIEAAAAVGERASSSTDELRSARRAVAEARSELLQIERVLSAGMRTIRQTRDAQAELDEVVSGARQALASLPNLDPLPPQLARLRDLVAANLVTIHQAPAGADLSQARVDLEDAVGALSRAAQPPPRALSEAATAYLSRDFDRVLELLGDTVPRTDRAAAHRHLLLAATLFGQWVASYERDAALLARAEVEARACRVRSNAVVPNARVFSPRFVRWFEETLDQPAAGPVPLSPTN